MDFQDHVGRQERQADVADACRIAGLAALLDHDPSPWEPDVLPPLGHWLHFQPQVRQSLIAADGHRRREDGGLLPAVDLPRRMWAGSRVRFLADIALGTPIERTSTLIAATPKRGRSGDMLFVTVRHEIAPKDQATAIVEEQDIVYREAATPGAPFTRPIVDPGKLESAVRMVTTDPVMLFRYSALTFNGHRIHYDREYTRDVEGYPGLVVHGPLIATLLLDHALRRMPGASIASYSFRALSPLFDGEAITLALSGTAEAAALRAIGPAGLAMTADIRFAAG